MIDRWRGLGQQVELETEMTLKDVPGIPEIIGQSYRLISSSGEIYEPPPVR